MSQYIIMVSIAFAFSCLALFAVLIWGLRIKGTMNYVSPTPKPITSKEMRRMVDGLRANQPKMGRVICACCGKEYYLLNYVCDECK